MNNVSEFIQILKDSGFDEASIKEIIINTVRISVDSNTQVIERVTEGA